MVGSLAPLALRPVSSAVTSPSRGNIRNYIYKQTFSVVFFVVLNLRLARYYKDYVPNASF